MSEYLLRTVLTVKDKTGEKSFVSDNWYRFKKYSDLIEKVYRINPSHYECFQVEEITEDILIDVERVSEELEKEKKRKLWEELQLEFGDKPLQTT